MCNQTMGNCDNTTLPYLGTHQNPDSASMDDPPLEFLAQENPSSSFELMPKCSPNDFSTLSDHPTQQQIDFFLRHRSKSEGYQQKKSVLKKTGDQTSDLKDKRRVSFADTNGLALEEIRYLEHANRSGAPVQDSNTDSDADHLFKTDDQSHRSTSDRRFVPYFSLPWAGMGKQKMLLAVLEDRKICLEQVSISSPWRITGLILVKNMSFQKRVSVRRTLDKWKTFEDIDCQFVCSVNPSVDRFHFDLRFPFKLSAGTRLEMALCYEMIDRGGVQLWDNNLECNYAFWYNEKV